MTSWGRALAAVAAATLGVLAACSGGDTNAPDCDAIAAALVSRIEVRPATAAVNLGDSLQMTATAYSCAGALGDVGAFQWRSGDATIATVSPSGLVKALKSGSVSIFAAAQGKEGSASLTTQPVPVARVTVEPATATLGVGRTSTLTVTAYDAQDRVITGRPVTWSSANAGIVTVNQSGAITGVAAGGPVAVTATIEGKSDATQVTVTTIPVSSVTVAPATATIAASATQQFTATLRDELDNVLTGRAVNWTSSDPTIASITGAGGLATGLKPGTVTITATSEGMSGTALLTVNIGAPAQLGFLQPPASAVQSGGSLGTVTVEILDQAGNRTTSNAPVSIAIVDGVGGTLGGTTTVNATNGLATFSDLTLSSTAVGTTTFQLRATSGTLTPAQSSVAVTLQAFTLTVSKAGAGTGTVTSNPVGINCGATCSASYGSGTPVTLTAAAGSGSTFTGWSGGGCTGTGTCVVTVTAATTVTATFAVQTFTLTVAKAGAGSGTVTSNPAGIDCGATCSASYGSGTQVTLTAVAGSGSTFTGWSGGGCTGTGTCVVTVTAATTVTATFTVNTATLTVATAGTGTGGVTSDPVGIACGTAGVDCSHDYSVGTSVTLTASPATGSAFAGWSGGGCSGTGTCVLTVNAATTVTASFTLLPVISTTSLPDATTGQPYSEQLAATGGTTPYTWTVATDTLPTGLTLSAAGLISGTATSSGSATFTVLLTDVENRTDTQVLTLSVAAGALGFLVQPTNVNAGSAIVPAVQVEVRDANGGRVTLSRANVTLDFGVNAGGGTLSGSMAQAESGVATFSDVRISSPGNGYTLVASSAGLASDTSRTFRVR